MDYLARAELVAPLEELGFYLVGFGCTTCMVTPAVLDGVSDSCTATTLGGLRPLGNRNFEDASP